MPQVLAYLRVSGPRQEHRDGFTRQAAAIESHCKAYGLTLTKTYREVVSGTALPSERPQFSELLDTANSGDTIIVERLDRLARDLMVQENIIASLRRREVHLVSTTEQDLCGNEPSRKLIRQVMGAVHEYQKDELVARLKAAKKRSGNTGAPLPWGQHRDHTRALVEKWISHDAIALLGQGYTLRAIASALNAKGYRNRRGKPFAPGSIYAIVRKSTNSGGTPRN